MDSVKKMPNCAAAPNRNSFGFVSSGSKSIIAPMPMNSRSGNSSLPMPESNSRLMTPISSPCIYSCVMTPVSGMLTRIVPKPIGSSRVGSIFLAIAR